MDPQVLAARILEAHQGDVARAREAACRTASASSSSRVSDLFAEVVYAIALLGEGCPR
jgi:hypothetical protein